MPARAGGRRAAPSKPQPNHFELTGAGVRIVYDTNSLAGRPQLTYQDQQFTGSAIRVLASEIGQLVTVTVETVPDVRTVTLTLLVPTINTTGAATFFRTRAILTTKRTSIGGPQLVKGALQSYRVLALSGTAQVVAF
jgi:hypothetical protein